MSSGVFTFEATELDRLRRVFNGLTTTYVVSDNDVIFKNDVISQKRIKIKLKLFQLNISCWILRKHNLRTCFSCFHQLINIQARDILIFKTSSLHKLAIRQVLACLIGYLCTILDTFLRKCLSQISVIIWKNSYCENVWGLPWKFSRNRSKLSVHEKLRIYPNIFMKVCWVRFYANKLNRFQLKNIWKSQIFVMPLLIKHCNS